MPNTKSAEKAVRVADRKRTYNLRVKRQLKSTVKEVRELVAQGKKDEAAAKLPQAMKAIDKAAKQSARGVLKKNTASRLKSRLSKAINKLS